MSTDEPTNPIRAMLLHRDAAVVQQGLVLLEASQQWAGLLDGVRVECLGQPISIIDPQPWDGFWGWPGEPETLLRALSVAAPGTPGAVLRAQVTRVSVRSEDTGWLGCFENLRAASTPNHSPCPVPAGVTHFAGAREDLSDLAGLRGLHLELTGRPSIAALRGLLERNPELEELHLLSYGEPLDLRGLALPLLAVLWLRGVVVSPDQLTAVDISLVDSSVSGEGTWRLPARVRHLHLEDCFEVGPSTFVAEGGALESLCIAVRSEYSPAFFDTIALTDLPELRQVSIAVGSIWHLVCAGALPQLAEVSLSAARWGRRTVDRSGLRFAPLADFGEE